MRGALRRCFRCGICSYSTDNILDLDSHAEDAHNCNLCGLRFYNKNNHRCRFPENNPDNIENLQIGYGDTIDIPLDSDNNPVFYQKQGAFDNTIAVFGYDFSRFDISDILEGVEMIRDPLKRLVESFIRVHNALRLKLKFDILFYSPKENKDLIKQHSNIPFAITNRKFISDKITDCAKYVATVCDLLSHQISGLLVRKLLECEISLLKLQLHMVS